MTNAEALRAMPIQELALFLYRHGGCPPDPDKDTCFAYTDDYRGDGCLDCWLTWLKSTERTA